MSYPKDLDEYDEDQLLAELARRARLRASGRCDYCQQLRTAPPCRMGDRHARQVRVSELPGTRDPAYTGYQCVEALGGCGKDLPGQYGTDPACPTCPGGGGGWVWWVVP